MCMYVYIDAYDAGRPDLDDEGLMPSCRTCQSTEIGVGGDLSMVHEYDFFEHIFG